MGKPTPTAWTAGAMSGLAVGSVAIIVLLSLEPVIAQNQPAQFDLSRDFALQVEQQLRSKELKEVLWGAYKVGLYKLETMIPLLETLFAQPPFKEEWEIGRLQGQIYDTLIELHARVPAAVLLPQKYLSGEFIILLARAEPGRDDVLLDLMPDARSQNWYAIADLLLETRPHGYAAELLRSLHLKVSIGVSEDGNAYGYESFGGAGGGVGCGFWANFREYPPLGDYKLTLESTPDAKVLATGPVPVYYTRTVYPPGMQGPYNESFDLGPTNEDRMRYIVALDPGYFKDRELKLFENHALKWRDS